MVIDSTYVYNTWGHLAQFISYCLPMAPLLSEGQFICHIQCLRPLKYLDSLQNINVSFLSSQCQHKYSLAKQFSPHQIVQNTWLGEKIFSSKPSLWFHLYSLTCWDKTNWYHPGIKLPLVASKPILRTIYVLNIDRHIIYHTCANTEPQAMMILAQWN